MDEKQNRQKLLQFQSENVEQLLEAKKIVVNHLESAIEKEDSATVATMAEILKL